MPIRLIDAESFVKTGNIVFEEFWDELEVARKGFKYGILSHRWAKDEITFKDVQSGKKVPKNSKIGKACELAYAVDGFRYVWVDTCCIDRASSSEESEAINSMTIWYKHASRCYAYLSNVNVSKQDQEMEQQLRESEWFTRGWTLQELIAPRDLTFYNHDWNVLGTKVEYVQLLTEITSIDPSVLVNQESYLDRSIAQRMSWASARETTRIEDTAYCLLGIFDVNMPLLYGEREKAFFRLQSEIIKHTDDWTIFAWPLRQPDEYQLLARTPSAFADCQNNSSIEAQEGRSPFSITNRGLFIEVQALYLEVDTYVVYLNFATGSEDMKREGALMCIFLRRLNEADQFARVMHAGDTFLTLQSLLELGTFHPLKVFVRQNFAVAHPWVFRNYINGLSYRNAEISPTRFRSQNIW